MPNEKQMLEAIHKANPATLNKRYTPQQLQAAFAKLQQPAAQKQQKAAAPAPTPSGQYTNPTTSAPTNPVSTAPEQPALKKEYKQEQVKQNQTDLSGIGSQLAEQQARSGQGVFQEGAPFEPKLAERTFTGDNPGGWGGDRQKVQDAVYANLTRGLERDYAQGKEELQSQLTNQGNGPGTPRWNTEMNRFESDYANRRQDAQNQAIQSSGDELSREFGMQETLRGNQYQEQAGTRNQQLNEADLLSQLGLSNSATIADIAQKLAQAGYLKRQGRSSGGSGVYSPPNPNAPIFES